MKVEHREFEPLADDELHKMNIKNIRELKYLAKKLKLDSLKDVIAKLKKEQQ